MPPACAEHRKKELSGKGFSNFVFSHHVNHCLKDMATWGDTFRITF